MGEREELNLKQISFKQALNGSLNQLTSLAECSSGAEDPISVTDCVLVKNSDARSQIIMYSEEESCIGDIAREVVSVTELIEQASLLSLKIYKGESENIEYDRETANSSINNALIKVDTISKLNDDEVCRLRNEEKV